MRRRGFIGRFGQRTTLAAAAVLTAATMLFCVFGSQTADAALHNPIPADASGDPTFDFFDNQSLWAYVTSDLAGGRICVVADTEGLGSCDAPAMGRATTIAATIGTANPLIKNADLKDGTFRLLVEDSLHTPLETSQPFTVSPCLDCPKSPDASIVQAYKDAAQAMAGNMDGMCTLQGVLEKVAGKAIGMRGFDHKVDVKVGGSISLSTPSFVMTVSGGIVFSFEIVDPASAGINKALDILKEVACGAKLMYRDMALDPPDPNYHDVTPPQPLDIGPSTPVSLDSAIRSVDLERADVEAALHAFERYQGARDAHDAAAEIAQLAAAGDDSTALAAELDKSQQKLRAWADVAATDAELAGVMLSSSDEPKLAALYQRVHDTGFTPDEISQFHTLGYTDAAIDAIRTHASLDVSNIPVDTAYPDALRSIADALESQAEAVADFASEMYAIAARIGASVASDRAPVAVDDSLTVVENSSGTSFVIGNDTDPDGDALTVASWTQPAHGSATCTTDGNCTYTPVTGYAGPDTFSYTVTDGRGESDTGDVNVSVGPDHAPVAVDDTMTTAVGTEVSAFVIGNDTDADGDALSITSSTQAAHGLVTCFPFGTCLYDPSAGYAGPDAFSYTVSDGHGESDTADVKIRVLAGPHGLSPLFSDSGLISLSVDAIGYNNPASGPIRVHKSAAGAKVRRAFLFAAGTGFSSYVPADGDVTLDGSPVAWDSANILFNDLGSGNTVSDVTSLVKAKVDAAPAGDVTFTAAEPTQALNIDGEILAVVLDDPTVSTPRSVTLLYGAQKTSGDTFHVALASPVDKSNAAFELNLSLGVSYSYQPTGQFSTVDVNGTRMTSGAGGQDDCIEKNTVLQNRPDFLNYCQNGELITAGGIDDTNANPPDPNAQGQACDDGGAPLAARCDDELYSLLPFAQNGDTALTFNTANPSNDDNIFFAALDVHGGAAVVGEGVVLSPTSATNPVGETHTLTARVQDDAGAPLQGVTVHFQVTSGPNTGTGGDRVTGADGKAQFGYASAATGTDHIVASFTDAQGHSHSSNEVTKTWQASAVAAASLTVNAATGDFADPTFVSAVLKDSGTSSPLSGKSVTLKLNGAESCTATTDASGTAKCQLTPSEAAGGYPLTGSFAGDSGHQPSTGSATFTVTHEETALAYTGEVSAINGQPMTLSARLTTDDPAAGTPVAGRSVSLVLGSGGTAQACQATTTALGTATCPIALVAQATGSVAVSAEFTGDGYYNPATASGSANIFVPPATGVFVIGDVSAAYPALGRNVDFWGAQWAKENLFSGGSPPSAMKGFADSPKTITCGATWTSRPGNSSNPPTTIPGRISVIVSSKVTKSGSSMSGKILHIVVVQVNPGYGPSPGHRGTGTVVGTIC